MLEIIRNYYEAEYKRAVECIEYALAGESIFKAEDVSYIIDSTIKMMLGVAFFVQDESFNLSFDDVNKIYEEYREKMEDLG